MARFFILRECCEKIAFVKEAASATFRGMFCKVHKADRPRNTGVKRNS
jgi:hypothetical protein